MLHELIGHYPFETSATPTGLRWAPVRINTTMARAAILLLLCLGIGACGGGGSKAGTTSSSAPATAATDSSPVTNETATSVDIGSPGSVASTGSASTSRPGTTIAQTRFTATVAATFASARVIQLAAPVQGYEEVALSATTKYLRASGQPARLADIQTGARIEVRGTRGSGKAFLATEVVLL